MRRTRIPHLLLDVIVAATLTIVVAGPFAPATASAAGDAQPSTAYERFRQGERDFANRHDPAASSSR